MRTRSETTREAILQAALQLLSEREFANIGTGEIARAAGVAEGTIFRYFPSKADIYVAILQEKGNQVEPKILAELDAIEDPLGKLLYLAEQHLKFALQHRDILWVIHRESTFARGKADQPCFDRLRKLVDLFERILSEGARERIFLPGLDARACALQFVGTLHSILLEDRLFRGGNSSERWLRQRARAYHATLLRGILSQEET